MPLLDIIFYASLAGGFFMAFALGSNDVANSMASAVGAKAITIRQAVFIAAILNFLGAVLMGAHVTSTISKGFINPDFFPDETILVLGMFATLLASAFFVLLSTWARLPVSSTHAVIGALIGFGLLTGGPDCVYWQTLVDVVLSWVLTPFIALSLAFCLAAGIRRVLLRPGQTIQRIRRFGPLVLAATAMLVAAAFVLETPLGSFVKGEPWERALFVFVAGALTWVGSRSLMQRLAPKGGEHEFAEELFRKLQIFTSSYVALAHGSNDVANALGPVAGIYVLARHASADKLPLSMLVLGGLGIALGIGLLGHRVIKTVGQEITPLDNVMGFSADFSIATTVMASSSLGLPVSSTHVAVGSITGVGLSENPKNVHFAMLGKIFINWIVTLPVAAAVCTLIYLGLRAVVL